MTLIASSDNSGTSFPLIEAGTHHAVCYTVADIGTQYSEKFDSYARKVVITWELPNVRIDIERDGKTYNLPRAISKTYTLSTHEKSNLTKDLTSWRGKPFTDEERAGFDLRKVARKNCLIQIIHTQRGDKTYANVATVAKLMAGMEEKEPENPVVIYDMGVDGTNFPESMPEWIRKRVMASQEMQEKAVKEGGEIPPDEPSGDFDDAPELDETIPF